MLMEKHILKNGFVMEIYTEITTNLLLLSMTKKELLLMKNGGKTENRLSEIAIFQILFNTTD